MGGRDDIKKKNKMIKSRHEEVYKFYLDYLMENGKSPTSSEVARHLEVSRERARQILERMVEVGYLLKIDGKTRGKFYPTMERHTLKDLRKKQWK
jgi:DNA-binding IclR family transcriptional regulator